MRLLSTGASLFHFWRLSIMLSRTVSSFLILAILVISSLPVAAQSTQSEKDAKAAKVKEKILKIGSGNDTKVKVKLYSGTGYEGNLTRSGETDFDVTDKAGAVHSIKYADVKGIGGKNLSTGAKIGIGIGIGAAATLAFLLILVSTLDD
jgi:hypothetical protein